MSQNQHYIPRLLLKKFTDPSLPVSDPRRLLVYDIASREWRRMSPVQAGAELDFYTLRGQDGIESTALEDAFCKIEDRAAKIINKTILTRGILTDEEKAVFSYFVALMLVRVPFLLGSITSTINDIAKITINMMHHRYSDDPEGFIRLKEQMEQESGKQFGELTAEHLDPSHYRITANKGFVLGAVLEQAEHIAEQLYQMFWTFAHTTPDAPFITSDFPVGVFNPTVPSDMPKWMGTYGHGFGFKDVQVSLPLTRQICMLAIWKGPFIQHSDVNERIVRYFNIIRMKRAGRYLFCPSQSFPGNDILAQLQAYPPDKSPEEKD